MSKITEVRLTIAAFVYAIENDLKSIIKDYVLTNKTNTKFFKDNDLVSRVKERFLKENIGLDPDSNLSEFIEYLDFPDIHKIIIKNAENLPDSFADGIKKIAPELEALVPIRNRAMHTRPLLNGDFARIYSFAIEARVMHSYLLPTVVLTLAKIESDPNYVFTLSLPDAISDENTIAHNLPLPDFDETGLIGRRKDAEEIKNLILKNQVVTLIGTGGIGKSSLMLKVAYDLIDLKQACPFDIVIWVSAKTNALTVRGIEEIKGALADYSSVIDGIANQFEKKGANLEDNISLIMEYLDVFNVLLIIDNLETIQTESISEFIREAQMKCKIAITSRIGLGELEYRRRVDGLSDADCSKMIREIAKIRNNKDIEFLPHVDLVEIAKKLHNNPLAIKWFVNSVVLGKSPNDVLAKKDDLLEFCVSNVYEKLSPNGVKVLDVLRSARRPLSEAELIFLSEMPHLECRSGIIDLLTTTFIIREIKANQNVQQITYSISDFINEYLLKHHPLHSERVRYVQKMMSTLNKSIQEIEYKNKYNEFGLYSTEVRNSEERIASKLLMDALSLSRQKNFSGAIAKIEDVKGIAPSYFEIYRISAFIKASNDDLLGADADYITALELEPLDVRTLYFYAQFLLFKFEDIDGAREYVERVYTLRPKHPYANLLKSRLISAQSNFGEAILFLNDFIEKEVIPTSKEWRVAVSEIMHNCYRWGLLLADYGQQNFVEAAKNILIGAGFYEKAFEYRNIDKDLSDKLAKSLHILLSQIPKFYLEPHLKEILMLHAKYADQMALSDSYPLFVQRVYDVFGVELNKSYVVKSENSNRLKGLISQYYSDKYFVFIESGSERLFAHKSNFRNIRNWADVSNGCVVVFDKGTNAQGVCAINIELALYE